MLKEGEQPCASDTSASWSRISKNGATKFYENVLGFRRLGDVEPPGHFPGQALDLSDGEVNYSLLQPNETVTRSEWTPGIMGPNHIGVTIEDTAAVVKEPRGAGHQGVRRRGSRPAPVLQVP